MKKIYYDYSVIDGYQCPLKIIVSRRGLGKTFGKVRKGTENFITEGERFIYVVETGEMVKKLAENKGEKFWSALLKYYGEKDTSRKRYFYSKITSVEIDGEEEENGEIKRELKIIENTSVVGGTVKVNGETAGYIIDLNSFGELKRNNFVNIGMVIVDEFISEVLDKRSLENPRKVSSIIQSIARLKNIKIYMLGNAVRLDDPILSRMGFKIKKYGFYKRYDKKGLFAVLHFVDPKDYPDFSNAHEESVAGRFANMLGETNEEENKFIEDLPKNRKLVFPVKYKKNGYSINIVRDNTILTIRELNGGMMACVPFAHRGSKNLYCMTEKEQGFKMGYHIICNKTLRQSLMNMLRADLFMYYSEIEYKQLKIIIEGD